MTLRVELSYVGRGKGNGYSIEALPLPPPRSSIGNPEVWYICRHNRVCSKDQLPLNRGFLFVFVPTLWLLLFDCSMSDIILSISGVFTQLCFNSPLGCISTNVLYFTNLVSRIQKINWNLETRMSIYKKCQVLQRSAHAIRLSRPIDFKAEGSTGSITFVNSFHQPLFLTFLKNFC